MRARKEVIRAVEWMREEGAEDLDIGCGLVINALHIILM